MEEMRKHSILHFVYLWFLFEKQRNNTVIVGNPEQDGMHNKQDTAVAKR